MDKRQQDRHNKIDDFTKNKKVIWFGGCLNEDIMMLKNIND